VKYLAQSFGEMVERRLKALNTNAFSVEKAHGLPLDAIRNVTRSEKRSGPTLVRAEEICDALGLEFYIGPPRIPPGGFADADTETDFARPDAARGGYHAIPWHRPGLGTPSSPIALRQEWMSDHAMIPDQLRAVQPDELLVAGSGPRAVLAVIDTQAARRAANDIWCYEEKGKMVIARVAFDRGAIIITRENPPQPPRLLLESDRSLVTLQGRVVWLGSLT
jgi:hypothetical protein